MFPNTNQYYLLLLLLTCTACQEQAATLFEVVPKTKSNIVFENVLQPTKDLNILDYLYYYNGGGVAIGDINNDGLADIFFTGNQVKNKLYLNQGNFQFKDITEEAGVAGLAAWNTGVTMADVNGDGLLDIYVCAVSGIHGLEGHNELFINEGNLKFTEQADSFGLAFENYSTQAAFFDYDNDGDLDMYLLNHAVHTTQSYSAAATVRNKRDAKTGDKLLRNEQGKFVDISEQAGIYGSLIGYGLGICTADFNNDGYIDLYVSNDFHEDDYFYLNQGDGTFRESVKDYFGHISRFSMGSDGADINNDGYYDLITLDMMPEEESILKASVGADNIDVHRLKVNKLGFHHQYARNMLQINQGSKFFSETALYSNVAATDWSWSPLFADFDLDGYQDLFISNGIPKRPNDLDYIKYIADAAVKNQLNSTNELDQEVLSKMPSGAAQNYLYQGTGTLQFTDRTTTWLPADLSISNGSAYADLDNDGDLDLVTNNTNAAPLVYKNNQHSANHYLKLKLQGGQKNSFGIGSKAIVYQAGKQQYKQLFTTKGFQSASEPLLHFGFESAVTVDSIAIIWPDQTRLLLKETAIDTCLIIQKEGLVSKEKNSLSKAPSKQIFRKVKDKYGLDFIHRENNFLDFKRESLLPYQLSDRMQAMVVGDINEDGKEDVFFGGSKGQKAKLYMQQDQGFLQQPIDFIEKDAPSEDMDAILEDLDNQNGKDLVIVSGGGEFSKKSPSLLDRYYRNDGAGNFTKATDFPSYFENGSVIKSADIDKDGDIDLFVGGRAVVNQFGASPNSYLLENTKEGFKQMEHPILQKVGMVTDAIFSDYDADGDADLIVVGEWMAPTFFQNEGGVFTKISLGLESLNGLWQTIVPFDMDNDGDLDYILGNWGLNTKYKASEAFPLRLYYGDVDGNGQSESIIAQAKNGQYYTQHHLDELAVQLPTLKKKFTTYQQFAGKPLEAIFDKKTRNRLELLSVQELASGYLKNNKGTFVFVPFAPSLQLAPITNLLIHDFFNNGQLGVLLAGNYMGLTPDQGRHDGFSGALLMADGAVHSGIDLGINLINKQVSKMDIITIQQKKYVVVMIHNSPIELYDITTPFLDK